MLRLPGQRLACTRAATLGGAVLKSNAVEIRSCASGKQSLRIPGSITSFRSYSATTPRMIQSRTMLPVIDNSGARRARCIQVLGKKKPGKIGDIVVVSLRKVRSQGSAPNAPKIKVKQGEVCRAVIVRQRQWLRRANGTRIKFGERGVALLQQKNKPLGSRLMGPVPRELRYGKFVKMATMSSYMI